MSTHTIEHPATHPAAPGAAVAAAGRRDFYAPIHKALRLFMTRTLCAVGSTDPGDVEEVRATLDLLERLIALCEAHLRHENEFVASGRLRNETRLGFASAVWVVSFFASVPTASTADFPSGRRTV